MHPLFRPELIGLGLSFAAASCASVPPRATLSAPAHPAPTLAAPAPFAPVSAPAAVYRNPRIGQVQLRAHLDAAGRLLGPQVMYQVVEPGGWNVDAVENGPDEIVPARAAPAEAGPKIEVTGLMREDERPLAEARAREGQAAVFDAEAGWLLVPR